MTTHTNEGTVFFATTSLDESAGLDSSLFNLIAYNGNTQELLLRFKPSGDSYVYEGIGLYTFQNFINAPSLGAFYNNTIRGKFAGEPIEYPEVRPFGQEARNAPFEQVEWPGAQTKAAEPEPLTEINGFYSVSDGYTTKRFSTRKALNEWFVNLDIDSAESFLEVNINFTPFDD